MSDGVMENKLMKEVNFVGDKAEENEKAIKKLEEKFSTLDEIKKAVVELSVKVDKKQQVSDELKSLIEVNGRDAVVTAFKQCVGSTKLKETAGYSDMIAPAYIQRMFSEANRLRGELATFSFALSEAEDRHRNAVANINKLRLDIKTVEANAILNNNTSNLKNAAERDAFRRLSSNTEREILAEAEDLVEVTKSEINSTKYKYDTAAKKLEVLNNELNLLGSIFKFLA